MTRDELIEGLNKIQEKQENPEYPNYYQTPGHEDADELLLKYINDEQVSEAFYNIEKWYAQEVIMEWIVIMFCIINMLIGLMILRFVSKPKEPYFDVSDEYQKQLKSYRSIVRSNEKIIRELKKKEETR